MNTEIINFYVLSKLYKELIITTETCAQENQNDLQLKKKCHFQGSDADKECILNFVISREVGDLYSFYGYHMSICLHCEFVYELQ